MAEPSTYDPNDVRPVVATSGSGNAGLWAFLAILLIGGAWLFSALSANRVEQGGVPTAVPQGYGADRIASPPPLALPDRFQTGVAEGVPGERRNLPRLVRSYSAPPQAPRQNAPRGGVGFLYDPPVRAPEPVAPYTAQIGGNPQPAQATDNAEPSAERVTAGRLDNPSLTVPLGTVIPAVLETAIDSTRPGGVRALVQRDVYSFDGSRVLIQRGTRLYGEYDADLQRGQNRALVRWTRLLRPDGVTVALDSPATDPMGRAGIKGKVDGKFFQRLGGALLQSALDIGVGAATRSASNGVVVALPGSSQSISGGQSKEIQPTLKVKHGTSIAVYVARDLDFSSVGG